MTELSDEAKAAIADAIRIVKEDKQHAMLRDIHTRTTPTTDPKTPPPADPKTPPVVDPPPKGTPPADPPKRASLWSLGSDDAE